VLDWEIKGKNGKGRVNFHFTGGGRAIDRGTGKSKKKHKKPEAMMRLEGTIERAECPPSTNKQGEVSKRSRLGGPGMAGGGKVGNHNGNNAAEVNCAVRTGLIAGGASRWKTQKENLRPPARSGGEERKGARGGIGRCPHSAGATRKEMPRKRRARPPMDQSSGDRDGGGDRRKNER